MDFEALSEHKKLIFLLLIMAIAAIIYFTQTPKDILEESYPKNEYPPDYDISLELLEDDSGAVFPNDLILHDITIEVRDKNENPIEYAKIQLYNKDHSIYFPIYSEWDSQESCNRVSHNPGYWAETDSSGKATVRATKGDYLVSVRKEATGNYNSQDLLFLEKDVTIDGPEGITLQVDKTINLNVLKPYSSSATDFDIWATKTDRKPASPVFGYGTIYNKAVLQTNSEAKPTLLITKNPSGSQAGYIYTKDINTGSSDSVTISGTNFAELTFNSYGPGNSPEAIGHVQLELIDFFAYNFGIDFPTNPSATVYVSPQNVYIWFRLEKNSQSFALSKKNGNVLPLSAGQKETINFGGSFDLNLEVASYNPSMHGPRNYFWFIVTDAYGNFLNTYVTKNSAIPKVIVKEIATGDVVFSKELENNYPDIHTDTRDYTYFDNFEDYTVTFTEYLHEFGSINLDEVPMDQLEMELINFESSNIEFIMPKELEFLKSNWQNNYQKFYDEIYNLIGIHTTEKIPFRVVYDGADRAWAPIVWPMVAYECDTRNQRCWFLITHELGHPYTINDPISCRSELGCPYNEESKASYLGITSSHGVKAVIGDYIKSDYPVVFKYLDDPNVCYDKIEFIQTLMLYLDTKYPNKKPSVSLIKEWDNTYRPIYDNLRNAGYTHDEAYGALYSIVVNENLGLVFQTFGLANETRTTSALNHAGYAL